MPFGPNSGGGTAVTAVTQAQGDNSTKIATTSYVDSAITQFEIKDPVVAATTTALLFTPTYANGTAGVGATLTGTVGILILDGYTPVLNDRLLIKNQASTLTQGIYAVTRVGTAIIGYILTRTIDFNQTANVLYGDSVAVLQGTENANQQFTMNNQNAITVGSTAITFAQTSGGSQLTQGANIVITGNSVAVASAPVFPGPVTSANGVVGATVTGTGGTAYGGIVPIILYFKNVTVLTAGAPVDVATIALPSGISRYCTLIGASASGGGGHCVVETAAGTLAAAVFELRDTAGGVGNTLVSFSGMTVAENIVNAGSFFNGFITYQTIYIRQTANSANAGTCSFYVTIFPLP